MQNISSRNNWRPRYLRSKTISHFLWRWFAMSNLSKERYFEPDSSAWHCSITKVTTFNNKGLDGSCFHGNYLLNTLFFLLAPVALSFGKWDLRRQVKIKLIITAEKMRKNKKINSRICVFTFGQPSSNPRIQLSSQSLFGGKMKFGLMVYLQNVYS